MRKIYKSISAHLVKEGEQVYFHPTLKDYTPAKVVRKEDGTTFHYLKGGNRVMFLPSERVYVVR